MIPSRLIKQQLLKIEREEQVTILYAAESGSRAWGFESVDSDFDVRFIYKHSLDWYMSLDEKRDVIEHIFDGSLDVSGWDIKKALTLFSNSNPPLYEWLQSPIVYRDDHTISVELRKRMPVFYSPVTALHHYLHMAKGNYKEYLTGEMVPMKKYFYVLRPLLACKWIETRKSMPPMEFETLLSAQKIDKGLLTEIKNLLSKKRAGQELGKGRKVDVIDSFLKDELAYYDAYGKQLKSNNNNRSRYEELNRLFRTFVASRS